MAFKAIGSVLKFYDTQGTQPAGTFNVVSQIKSMTGPTAKPRVIDVTTHDVAFTDPTTSQIQFWTRKLPVLIDSGEFNLEIFYNPTDLAHSLPNPTDSFWGALTNMHYTQMYVVFPPSSIYPFYNGLAQLFFSGYITQYEFSLPVDNAITGKIQITITDQIQASVP